MKLIFSLIMAISGWLPGLGDEPAIPEEIEKIDLNLTDNEYAMTFFALDQGDAAIIQGKDSTILINTGPATASAELKAWLTLYDVKKIDAVILTKTAENLPDIVADYDVTRVIAGKKMQEDVSSVLSDFPEVEINSWSLEQSKEMVMDGIEISVVHENDTEGSELDLSIKIQDKQLLYLTSSSEELKNKLMKLDASGIHLIKAPIKGLSFDVAKHLDPQAVILYERYEKKAEKEMIQKFHELWIEVFNTAEQGTVTAKFTENNHEIFPIKNFVHTKN
ncbi:hypothetical protein [Bacillus sp. CECT 9360]|uniref:hypothetical protein n=1 Tax=Bacillus sp. CECT 9360 TaxID=2845821 RepID=UPI001E51E58D|nr:hypothetical protein [Bacillus sp. CECT 9360]CAH0345516.1 hypothetical protein BCI9360_01803 [Bacillus sp. CECT 9360]